MKKILVIDDETDFVEILQDFLGDCGYEVFAATNAHAGLEIAQKKKPDLILLDVLMPGITGIECLRQIKKIQPDALVVMISGLQDEHLAKEAICQGASDYITKPFDLEFIRDNVVGRMFAE